MGLGELPGRVLSGIVSVPALPELEPESDLGPEPQLRAGIDIQLLFLLTALDGDGPTQKQPTPQPIPEPKPETETEAEIEEEGRLLPAIY